MEKKIKKEVLGRRVKATVNSDNFPISKVFFGKHIGKIFLVLFMLYGYIQLRYAYDQAVYDLGKLKEELADARYVSISTWGELTSKNKPDSVRNIVNKNVELITADEPPYVLK